MRREQFIPRHPQIFTVATASLASAALFLSGCSGEGEPQPVPGPETAPTAESPDSPFTEEAQEKGAEVFKDVAGYLPAYVSPDAVAYAREHRVIGADVHYSFLTFNAETQELQRPVEEQQHVLDYLKELHQEGSEIYLAAGGWDGEGQKTPNAVGFAAAMQNPETFTKQFDEIADQYRSEGIDVSGIVFDYEFPKAGQSEDFAELIAHVKAVFPNFKIKVSVAPDILEGLTGTFKNQGVLDCVDLMAYNNSDNQYSFGGNPHLAPGAWVMDSVDALVEEYGVEPEKICVGFPMYASGYRTDANGGVIREDLRVAELPTSGVQIDAESLANFVPTLTADGREVTVSFTSPELAREIMGRIVLKYPTLGGAFVWENTQGPVSKLATR